MPVIGISFTYYVISYSSPVNAQTSIYLLQEPKRPFQPVAVLSFYGGDVPPNGQDSAGNPKLNFPRIAFRDVIDILRNERPLELVWDTDTCTGSIQSAAAEPVGEEET